MAVICASPIALLAAQVGKGKKITSYPMFKEKLGQFYKYDDEKAVVVDGHFITSRGPATAMAFALEVIEHLTGKDVRRQVEHDVLLNKYPLGY